MRDRQVDATLKRYRDFATLLRRQMELDRLRNGTLATVSHRRSLALANARSEARLRRRARDLVGQALLSAAWMSPAGNA